MTPVAVKICGVNSAEAFDAVHESRADYLGFVFFPPSPRFVTPGQAAALSARATGGPKRVGLFVNPSDTDIAATLAGLRLDVLQVYADTARCQRIKARFQLPVWRAVAVSTPADLPRQGEGLDGFVIESPAPPGASRPGGNAVNVDRTLLSGWTGPGFWLLAGGLDGETVAQAIAQLQPPGVDVSSGVETAPGAKSRDLILRFVERARTAGNLLPPNR
jgi:phosphoribosylanthranilate isomerase